MSVLGYFSTDGRGSIDRWVERKRAEEISVPAAGGPQEFYLGVARYDPVLLAHCRLVIDYKKQPCLKTDTE
jgi:hypothetical protein